MNIDDRISAALRAAAGQVTEESLRPALPPSGSSGRTGHTVRWAAPLLAAAAVIGIAVAVTAVSSGGPSAARKVQPGNSSSGALSSSVSQPATSGHPVGSPATPAPGSLASRGSAACVFADTGCKGVRTFYVPLWPFGNAGQAKQVEPYLEGCAKHRCPYSYSQDFGSPGATALDFTRNYLNFTEINRVTSTSVAQDEAHIGVGYLNPNGKPVTAAVIHLLRYESVVGDKYAPWEVVGTDDTTFSLETPTYGSSVPMHFQAAGHITGVDENIDISLLHTDGELQNGNMIVMSHCCLPAGGQNSPWSLPLQYSFSAAIHTGSALMAVVSTGGHLQQVERFAVQGFYAR